MSDRLPPKHSHYVHRIGWLRAAVLGANDGIVSVGSLIVGVAAASSDPAGTLVAGSAGLVAGAMSMAAGEFVSVSSQSDTEQADLEKERHWLDTYPEAELTELARIYEARGVRPDLAREVARELMHEDALAAHARDELGISHVMTARPIQAALISAVSFSLGASVPLAAALLGPANTIITMVAAASLVSLAILGVVSARLGGAPMARAVVRVLTWGIAAMVSTTLIGMLVGSAV